MSKLTFNLPDHSLFAKVLFYSPEHSKCLDSIHSLYCTVAANDDVLITPRILFDDSEDSKV